jgi:integrase
MQQIDPLTRWERKVGTQQFNRYKLDFQNFLARNKITDPSELLKLDLLDATDLAEEFYDYMISQNYSNSKASNAYTAVRSFFSYNGRKLGKVQKKFQAHAEYTTDCVCTQKQVYDIISDINKCRDKGAVGVIFQGGQRDGLVSALKLKYIETPDWENAKVVVFAIPDLVLNARGLNVNKNKTKYRFAILDDVAVYIKRHLDERRKAGEVLTPESWLFRTRRVSGNGTYMNPLCKKMTMKPDRIDYSDPRVYPITQWFLNKLISTKAEKLGFQSYVTTKRGQKRAQVHGHSGRAYFKTQARKAKIDADLRDFLIGHKVPFGGAYDKFTASEITQVMEESRAYLAITPESGNEVEKRKQGIEDQIKILKGFMTPEQYESFKIAIIKASTSQELQTIVSNRLIQVRINPQS